MARAAGTTRKPKPVDEFRVMATDYVTAKADIKTAEKVTSSSGKTYKGLMETLANAGVEDSDGHLWIELTPPIDGGPVGVIEALQRQRRVGRGYDEDEAVARLTKAGLMERCYKTVTTTVLDEDEVYKALEEGLLKAKDIDAIWPESITWALQMKKA